MLDEQLLMPLRDLQAAAARGAMGVSGRPQVIADAVEYALERWQRALESSRVPRDLTAWGYRVGANAAKRIGRGLRHRERELTTDVVAFDAMSDGLPPDARRLLRAHLPQFESKLRASEALRCPTC